MGKPCVSGAAALEIDLHGEDRQGGGDRAGRGRPDRDRRLGRRGHRRRRAARGARGIGALPDGARWADELRTLGVRANADTPEDAAKAREFGAEGIGLCRTEHMFMAADRQPKMRAMIMAETEEDRRQGAGRAAAAPAGGLRGPVRGDERAAGHDPAARPAAARVPPAGRGGGPGGRARADRGERTTSRSSSTRSSAIHSLAETNPMLGTRGVRLGVLHPRSTRCRCGRSCGPRWRSRRAARRSRS